MKVEQEIEIKDEPVNIKIEVDPELFQLDRTEQLSDNKELFCCSVCDESFCTQKALTDHLHDHLQEEFSPKAKKKNSLNNKGNSVTKDKKARRNSATLKRKEIAPARFKFEIEKNGNLKCKNCPKTFTSQARLTRHEKTHGDHNAFSCKLCNKHFASGNDYQRHLSSKRHLEKMIDLNF